MNSIDQNFRTYSRSSRITHRKKKKTSRRVWVSVFVSDSHLGMKVFGLKHEWLFHGRMEMPCPCQSRPQQAGGRAETYAEVRIKKRKRKNKIVAMLSGRNGPLQ